MSKTAELVERLERDLEVADIAAADIIKRLERERDELRRAIINGEPDPALRHGNFLEMAQSLHTVRDDFRERVATLEGALRMAQDAKIIVTRMPSTPGREDALRYFDMMEDALDHLNAKKGENN